MDKLGYRQYTDKDYDFIYNVKKISYEKYVIVYYKEWNDQIQHCMLNEFLEAEKTHIKILMIGDDKIGFINGKDISNEVYEQGNICILPEWQRKGIGTILLKQIIETHKNQDSCLKVFKINPAQNLYKRMGFEIYGETHSHYLMKRKNL